MTRGQGGGPKRKKPADLHSVAVHVRLAPAEAARLDAVRGEEARAAVLRTGGMAEVERRERAADSEPIPAGYTVTSDGRLWTLFDPFGGVVDDGLGSSEADVARQVNAALRRMRVAREEWDARARKSASEPKVRRTATGDRRCEWPSGAPAWVVLTTGFWYAWAPDGTLLASGTAPTQPEAEAAARAALGEYTAKQGRTP